MYLKKFFISLLLFFFHLQIASSFTNKNPQKEKALLKSYYQQLTYNNQHIALPAQSIFELAITGYLHLKEGKELSKEKKLLSIIDFSKKSSEKRYWLVDLENFKVLHYSLVAHGKNTGFDKAMHFSNIPSSFQSSLGFYATGKTYYGKHGLSLYLHGKDKGFNDKAKERAIVIHGANYVSENFVKQHGRLGRSLGCPALPMSNYKAIINKIKEGTCLFIYYPSQDYIAHSTVLNTNSSQENYISKVD